LELVPVGPITRLDELSADVKINPIRLSLPGSLCHALGTKIIIVPL
jgi:hypothetical protein